MATFYKAINNGVIAIVPERTHEQILVWNGLTDEEKAVRPYPRPIFTFVRPEYYKTDRWSEFVTGDYDTMDRLLKGHRVVDASFYVPFSNGHELMSVDAQEREYRTTRDQEMHAFWFVDEETRRLTTS